MCPHAARPRCAPVRRGRHVRPCGAAAMCLRQEIHRGRNLFGSVRRLVGRFAGGCLARVSGLLELQRVAQRANRRAWWRVVGGVSRRPVCRRLQRWRLFVRGPAVWRDGLSVVWHGRAEIPGGHSVLATRRWGQKETGTSNRLREISRFAVKRPLQPVQARRHPSPASRE